jgi:hypothetical protein
MVYLQAYMYMRHAAASYLSLLRSTPKMEKLKGSAEKGLIQKR